MGTWYKYKCNNIGCGYKIYTSAGIDRGLYTHTKTMVCKDCNEIKEISIKKYGGNIVKMTIDEFENFFKGIDTRDSEEVRAKIDKPGHNASNKNEKLICPTCKGENLKEWDDDSCPYCNSLMIRDENDRILWD